MNSVLIGQSAEVKQNIPIQRSAGSSSSEGKSSDSFANVFASVSEQEAAEIPAAPEVEAAEHTASNQVVSEGNHEELGADLDTESAGGDQEGDTEHTLSEGENVAAVDDTTDAPIADTPVHGAVEDNQEEGEAVVPIAEETEQETPDLQERDALAPEEVQQTLVAQTSDTPKPPSGVGEAIAHQVATPRTDVVDNKPIEGGQPSNSGAAVVGALSGADAGQLPGGLPASNQSATDVPGTVDADGRLVADVGQNDGDVAKSGDTLTLVATDSVDDLPIAYRLRIGTLPPAQQEALREFLVNRQLIDGPGDQAATAPVLEAKALSPEVLSTLQGLAGASATELQSFLQKAGLDLSQLEHAVSASKDGLDTVDDLTIEKAAPPSNKAAATGANMASLAAYSMHEAAQAAQAAQAKQEAVAEARLDEAAPAKTGAGPETSQATISTPSAQISHSALMAQIGLSQRSLKSESRPDLEMRFGAQPIGLNQSLTEAAFKPVAMQGPEVVQRIAAQLSEAFASKGERKVDVLLNPKELGQVKMQLATSENGVRVTIQVERSETGDLMRRHIGELEQEFQDMGFENISFSFSSDDSQSHSGGSGHDQTGGSGPFAQSSADDTVDSQTPQPLNLGGSGLDMRV